MVQNHPVNKKCVINLIFFLMVEQKNPERQQPQNAREVVLGISKLEGIMHKWAIKPTLKTQQIKDMHFS